MTDSPNNPNAPTNLISLADFGTLSDDSAPIPPPVWSRAAKANPLAGPQSFVRATYACGCWVQWRAGARTAPLPHANDIDPWDYASAWLGNWHQERACSAHGGPEWRWNEDEKDHARVDGTELAGGAGR